MIKRDAIELLADAASKLPRGERTPGVLLAVEITQYLDEAFPDWRTHVANRQAARQANEPPRAA